MAPVRGSQVRHNNTLVEQLRDQCAGANLVALASRMREVLVEEAWRARYVMRLAPARLVTFESFEEFVRTPSPSGLGEDPVRLGKLLESDPDTRRLYHRALAKARTISDALRGNQNARPKSENGSNNVTPVSPPRGNTATYLARRLNRDHPAIADALARGQYRSVRAAAIAAGIVTPPTAYELAQRAYLRLTIDDGTRFRQWLLTLCDPS